MSATPRSAGGAARPVSAVPQIFHNGRAVTVRQVRASDAAMLASFVARLSPRTRHMRYLAVRDFTPATARAEAERIAAARTRRHLALVASAPRFGNDELVGVLELAPFEDEPGVAELAVVVCDDMQGGGVGSLLMRTAAIVAPQLGVHTLHIEMLADNARMRRLADHVGAARAVGRSDGVLQLRVRLSAGAEAQRRAA